MKIGANKINFHPFGIFNFANNHHACSHPVTTAAAVVSLVSGGIVDTDSLTEALTNGEISAAALDVTDPEPLPEGHPLLKLNNLTITPHWASATVQVIPLYQTGSTSTSS